MIPDKRNRAMAVSDVILHDPSIKVNAVLQMMIVQKITVWNRIFRY